MNGFKQLTAAVKQRATIEQLEHNRVIVGQNATNERVSAARGSCEAESDERVARAYQHHGGAEGDE